MITVGVTGGIGSGKTTVCNIWKNLGAYILSADDLAKSLMTGNSEVRALVRERFGENSYHEDGSLNRTFLAEEAFGKNRVEELNAIVHPRIPAECRAIMNRERLDGRKVFVYEAALLLQNLRPCHLDYIVLVLAGRQMRIDRVTERDGLSKEQVQARIEKQQAFEKLVHLADFVIYNNGSLESLREKAEGVYKEFLERRAD